MPKILIIEDDQVVSFTLKAQFEKEGFEVIQLFNGASVIKKTISFHPDLILLDIGLPDISGYELCQELRKFYQGALVFLTGHENHDVEITCFELGADDFVPKSAPFQVLFERIKRLGVRAKTIESNESLVFGDLLFKPSQSDCCYKEKPLGLTQEEYELIYFIAAHHGEAVSRQMILKVLKGSDYNGVDRSVDIKIARIRSKLKAVGLPSTLIQSVRSKGYAFSYPL